MVWIRGGDRSLPSDPIVVGQVLSLFAELLLVGAVGVHDPELVSPFVVGDSGAVG